MATAEYTEDQLKSIFGAQLFRVQKFADLLREEGELRGLIGPRELPRLWSRHILNSAAVVEVMPDTGRVMDLGSGGGFPGVVLALMRPDLEFVLVEPMERRCEWLNYAKAACEAKNINVVRARVEEIPTSEKFEVVTARAVAALDKLSRWALPYVKPGGALMAMKGMRAADEIDAAQKVFRKHKVAYTQIHKLDSIDEASSATVVEVRLP